MVLKNASLFTDQFQEPCFTINGNSNIACKINSKQSKRFMAKLFWNQHKKAVSQETINTAINTLEGLASESHTLHVFNRVGQLSGEIFYDIGDNIYFVKIDSNGWEITASSPIMFRRYPHQKPQVLPQKDGRLQDVLKFFNIKDELSEILLLTYLPVCLIPDIPRPVFILHGDQGSAKSTTLKIIRSLIDPSQIPLLSPPDSARELIQIASHHYAVYLDNLSGISSWLSDCLCRLVTGDGFSKRQLYTDDDDILYSYKRLTGLSGINQVATRPDLLDRSIIIPLDRISDSKRLEEKELWGGFEEVKPKLFGALLNAVSACLKTAPGLSIPRFPRMADYFRFACAAAVSLGYSHERLHSAFNQNIQYQNQAAIESSAVAQVILEFMEDKESWQGNSSELYEKLETIAERLKVKRGFPNSATWLWRRIKEVRPNLMACGVEANRGEKASASQIELTRTKLEDAATVATSNENVAIPNETMWQQNGSSGNNGSRSEETIKNMADSEIESIFGGEIVYEPANKLGT
jgi:hypothetical protein